MAGVHDQAQPGSVQDGSLQPGRCGSTDLGLDTGAHHRLLEGGGAVLAGSSGITKGTSTGATGLRLDGSGGSLDMGAAPPCQLPGPRSAAGDSSAAAAGPEGNAPARPPPGVDSGQPPAASAANPALCRAGLGSDAAAAASSMWGGQASSGTRAPSGQAAAVTGDAGASASRVSPADPAAGSNHGQASAGSTAEPESSGSFTQQSVAHYQSTACISGDPSQQPPTRWQSTASSFSDARVQSTQALSEQDSSRLAHQPPSCDHSAAATQQLPVRYQRTLSSSSQGSALRSEGQAAQDGGLLRGGQDSARWAQRSPTRYQSAVSAFGDAMEGTPAEPGGQTVAPAAGEAGAGFDSRQALQAAAAETALTLGLCDGCEQQEGPACPLEQAAPDGLQQSRAGTGKQSVAESVQGQGQDSAACPQGGQEEPELPAPQQSSRQPDAYRAEQKSGPQEAAGQAASGDSPSPAAAARSPELAALLARAAAFCDRTPQQNFFRCACMQRALLMLSVGKNRLSCDRKFAFCHRRPQQNLPTSTCRLLLPVLV